MWNEKENYQCFEHSLDSLEAQTSRERVTPNTIAAGTFAKPYTNIYLLSYYETSSPTLKCLPHSSDREPTTLKASNLHLDNHDANDHTYNVVGEDEDVQS